MPADLQLSISVHDNVPVEEGRIVDNGLGKWNDHAAPLHDVRPLSCHLAESEKKGRS